MARRIAQTTLNASTIDILNVIRQNASYEYQQNVPVVATEKDIPKVGEILLGTPALANQFLNALLNRIALVKAQSATFNNPYSHLKKGYLEFGETVEDIFVNIAKVVKYDMDKAKAREFKITHPDVRSAFYVRNWQAMYPVTINDTELQTAFLSINGVTDLIGKIVDSIYTAAEYDEFLLFKYLLIKSIAHGKMYPIAVSSGSDLHVDGTKYRGMSNLLPFMKSDYNEAGVLNTTPKERQCIFMDATYNAQYDVNVLASAFNMDKATYEGKLHLIDDWSTFDNARFEEIRELSDGLEEVTAEELTLLKDVRAVLIDENWFQVYDNVNKFTETYVSSGLYRQFFYHSWKTIAHSPFANAVVFVSATANIDLPDELTAEVQSKSISAEGIVLNLVVDDEDASFSRSAVNFVQTEALTTAGIGVQKFGSILIPSDKIATAMTITAEIGEVKYVASTTITASADVGDTITLAQA